MSLATKKLTSDTAIHMKGEGSNMLCFNGSAHARGISYERHVTCPACLRILKTGCSAVEASKAWKEDQ